MEQTELAELQEQTEQMEQSIYICHIESIYTCIISGLRRSCIISEVAINEIAEGPGAETLIKQNRKHIGSAKDLYHFGGSDQ